jgi:predicted NBD/HSP70 family sugar kinase
MTAPGPGLPPLGDGNVEGAHHLLASADGKPADPATAIGVDVGASRLKLALVDQTGAVLVATALPTPRDGDGPAVVEQIAAAITSFRDAVAPAAPRGIGIVVPHYVDGPNWVQRWANSMPAVDGLALRPLLARRLPGPLAMANDVSAAAMAEHMFGRGRGVDRLLLMAIGTGISIGMIVDGELLQYSWGTAGDTGHIVVDTEELHECSCGGRGCLETVASGTGIRDAAVRAAGRGESELLAARLKEDPSLTAADVAEAARLGDAAALRIYHRAAFFLGAALASYVQIFCPSLIVLAGGVIGSSDLLLDDMRSSLRQLVGPSRLSAVQGVDVSAFPDTGAAIGSAGLILHPGRYLRDGPPTEVQLVS